MSSGQYKRWVTLGCISGVLASFLLVALATQAFGANTTMTPKVTVVAVLVILLGFMSISLVVGANICRVVCVSREEYGRQKWWKGYNSAVEDLKADGKIVDLLPRDARR